jgi:hypothetical protein
VANCLKRGLVLILSNISLELLFNPLDSLLNLLRFNEPAEEYERTIEIFLMHFLHFVCFSRLLNIDFQYQHFSLYFFGTGLLRYLYYVYLKQHVKDFLSAVSQAGERVGEICLNLSCHSLLLLGILLAAVVVLFLAKMDRSKKRLIRADKPRTALI